MNIHEYQAKALLQPYGVPVPKGAVVFSAQEALDVANTLTAPFVVKAQIHAGGRGKGGGVKLVQTSAQVKEAASKMLGMTLVTPQTGPEGRLVSKVYVEEGCAIAHEFYLSLLVDRATARLTFLASREGGMDIEEVASDRILKVAIDPVTGFQPFHGRKLAEGLGLTGSQVNAFAKIVRGVYEAFMALDASLIEMNPFVVTPSGDFVALDVKMSFDESALYRHPDICALRDLAEEDPMEVTASEDELSYIKLHGNIGCMVNGAGLAMATLDIITLYGGEPANFLDLGGGADQARVTKAFKIILSDKAVNGVFVNIFGGIMRCDIIAEGIVDAVKTVNMTIPLVVRLEGTNVDLGKEIFAKSGLPIIAVDGFAAAAQRIVQEVA